MGIMNTLPQAEFTNSDEPETMDVEYHWCSRCGVMLRAISADSEEHCPCCDGVRTADINERRRHLRAV